jgi:hypothetical protein
VGPGAVGRRESVPSRLVLDCRRVRDRAAARRLLEEGLLVTCRRVLALLDVRHVRRGVLDSNAGHLLVVVVAGMYHGADGRLLVLGRAA